MPEGVYSTSFGRGFDSGSTPVEQGKEYDVSIIERSRKGDGIARIQGFVIFVKDRHLGQNCKNTITQLGNRFATAEIIQ